MIAKLSAQALGTPRRLLQKTLRWSSNIFLVGGFLGVAWFLYWLIQGSLYQRYQSYQLNQSLRGQSVGQADVPSTLSSQDEKPENTPDRTLHPGPTQARTQAGVRKPAVPLAPGLIGRIEIPRVNISAVVREGVDARTLSRAVGHVPGTSLPGQNGNMALAAHRERLFRGLRFIGKGDSIRLITETGTYTYAVDSISIVSPADVHVLAPTPEPVITLVTCYPFSYVGRAPNRFIVRARQVGLQPGTMPDSRLQ